MAALQRQPIKPWRKIPYGSKEKIGDENLSLPHLKKQQRHEQEIGKLFGKGEIKLHGHLFQYLGQWRESEEIKG